MQPVARREPTARSNKQEEDENDVGPGGSQINVWSQTILNVYDNIIKEVCVNTCASCDQMFCDLLVQPLAPPDYVPTRGLPGGLLADKP